MGGKGAPNGRVRKKGKSRGVWRGKMYSINIYENVLCNIIPHTIKILYF